MGEFAAENWGLDARRYVSSNACYKAISNTRYQKVKPDLVWTQRHSRQKVDAASEAWLFTSANFLFDNGLTVSAKEMAAEIMLRRRLASGFATSVRNSLARLPADPILAAIRRRPPAV